MMQGKKAITARGFLLPCGKEKLHVSFLRHIFIAAKPT
jgi:hypothetical protein